MIIELILLILLLFLSAFFSGSEVALVAVDKLSLKRLIRRKVKNVKYLRMLKREPRHMLTTILIGNNFINILISSLATVVSINSFGSLGVGLAIGLVTFLLIIFGEIVPKGYCQANKEFIALKSAKTIYYLSRVFSPIIALFDIIPSFMFKYIIKSKPRSKKISDADIVSLAEMGVQQKSIDLIEMERIKQLLKFDDMSIEKIMIPKSQVIVLNGNMSVKQALKIVDTNGHSRYPVYEGRKYNYVGIVHVKEMLKALQRDGGGIRIRYLVIHAPVIYRKMLVSDVFKILQREKVHMAFITNKKMAGKRGSIVGIITLEDIIEEIFGEIEDESDVIRSLGVEKI